MSILSKQNENTSSTEDVPDLSASVESVASECAHQSRMTQSTELTRKDSYERIRGKDKHMTPSHLAQLMIDLGKDNIQDAEQVVVKKTMPQNIQSSIASSQVASSSSLSDGTSSLVSAGSESSSASNVSSHSIVRGFAPGLVSNSYRSSVKLDEQIPEESSEFTQAVDESQAQNVNKKKSKMFTIGSSVSDESGSLDSRFGSALTSSLKRAGSTGSKRTAFVDQVSTRTVFDEDDELSEDENVSESAIEDDDDASDWDSVTESGQSSYSEDNMFARVEEPRPVLTSRRSLLSTLLHQGDRAAALARAGSRSTPAMRSRTSSPLGPSLAPSPSQDSPIATANNRTQPLPIIMTTSNTHPPALSPRTTRRNMLAQELTESLRKHLLWERQQKNPLATAVLKRRHTAHDLVNMKNEQEAAARQNSYTNNYFDSGLPEYNNVGW